MKIIIEKDNVQTLVCELTQTDINILRAELKDTVLYEDIRRRLEWVLKHKIDVLEQDLKTLWVKKFMEDPFVQSIPADRVEFFKIVFAHPEFKFASQREDV